MLHIQLIAWPERAVARSLDTSMGHSCRVRLQQPGLWPAIGQVRGVGTAGTADFVTAGEAGGLSPTRAMVPCSNQCCHAATR